MVGPLGVPGSPGPVGGDNLGVLLTAAHVAHAHAQEPNELRLVRMRLRQAASEPRSRTRSPSPVACAVRTPAATDLACREALSPERARAVPTGPANRKRGLDAAPAGPRGACKRPGDRFSKQDIDDQYWQKHTALTTMMNGFACILARKLESLHAADPPSMINIVKQTKATQPHGALKTQRDMEILDKLMFQVCQSHTKLTCNVLQDLKDKREAKEAKGGKGGAAARRLGAGRQHRAVEEDVLQYLLFETRRSV